MSPQWGMVFMPQLCKAKGALLHVATQTIDWERCTEENKGFVTCHDEEQSRKWERNTSFPFRCFCGKKRSIKDMGMQNSLL